MALDTEKRDPRDIDESAHIPNGGFIGEEETSTYVYLPTYNFTLSHEFSSSNHLTLTDCHIAMKATLHKARLIIFEIARQNRPFHRRHLKKIILSGSIRDLDKNLSSTSSDLDGLLSIGTYVYGHSRLHDLLMNSLVAHESFKDSSTKLKRSFLRSEKVFVQSVLQTLKQALIDRNTPNFTALIAEADQCSKYIEQACQKRGESVVATISELKEGEGYREAEKLDGKIKSLEQRASDIGLRWGEDKKYEVLNSNVFGHADGPSSLVAYLENWLEEHPGMGSSGLVQGLKLPSHPHPHPPPSVDWYSPPSDRYISPYEQPKPMKRKASEEAFGWLATQARKLWRRGASGVAP